MKCKVRVEWSGYSRGYDIREVEATTVEEAKQDAENGAGELLVHEIVRDDCEYEDAEVIV